MSALDYQCPTCHAPRGSRCRDLHEDKTVKTAHRARQHLARSREQAARAIAFAAQLEAETGLSVDGTALDAHERRQSQLWAEQQAFPTQVMG